MDHEYSERAIRQYERAIEQAGGEPVRIPLEHPPGEVLKMIESCEGILLPGSTADVDPARFKAQRSTRTAAADPRRDAVDELLLQDAYDLCKPVLGICYGLQSLNVYRAGSLIQHIPDFLPEDLRACVDHEAGSKVAVAHAVEIDANSKLAKIVRAKKQDSRANRDAGGNGASASGIKLNLPVNSSHHQSANMIGKSLRISAHCPDDGIIEALEGTASDHFVLAVQWHPERSIDADEASRAIFRALITAAEAWR